MTLARTGRPTRSESQLKSRVLQSRGIGNLARRQTIPEYLDPPEIEALLANAPHTDSELAILLQWRAGLRLSEAMNLDVQDLHLEAEPPVLRVRFGKGGKSRLVPLHGELRAALSNHIRFRRISVGRMFEVKAPSTAWRWYKKAQVGAERKEAIQQVRNISTHSLRHSAARHWLANGVPINQVSGWLEHASLQTTLIYLQTEDLHKPIGMKMFTLEVFGKEVHCSVNLQAIPTDARYSGLLGREGVFQEFGFGFWEEWKELRVRRPHPMKTYKSCLSVVTLTAVSKSLIELNARV